MRKAWVDQLPRQVKAEVRKALDAGAAEIVAMQRTLVPVDSGDLRDSIGYTFGKYTAENANVRGVTAGPDSGENELSVTIHAGNAKAFYAMFQEFGVVGKAAQPFFYPAWRAGIKKVKRQIASAFRKATKKLGGGNA